MQSVTVPALVIRRTYRSSPERVYQAWTDPELARQFLCPAGMSAEVSMDVREGGAFRIAMKRPDGAIYAAIGTYREVKPNSLLSMTWRWEENNPAEEHETLLTVEFVKNGSGTDLVLTHERLSTAESRENHKHGWTSLVEKLDALDLEPGTILAHAHLHATPERVFRALASEEIVKWWVRPGVFDTREWSGDVRPGGAWSASGMARGNPYSLTGTFLEVMLPNKLVHTWHLEGTPDSPTTITYVLEPGQTGTHVTLHQSGFAAPTGSENTRIGWETSFEALQEHLSGE